jgi:hypothetical protein
MPRLKSYKRIITSDYKKEDQEVVEQLGDTLNDAFGDIYYALNGRVELNTNISCSVRLVDVIVDSAGVPVSRILMGLNGILPVIGCQVIQAINQTNSNVYPTGAPFITYTQLDQAILINHITGLQANMRYTLRIVAYN